MTTKARGRCRHFTGAMNETCKADVNYRVLVSGPDLGWMARLPCVPDSPIRKEPVAQCDKYDAVTPAEEMAERIESTARMEKISEALRRIKETKQERGTVGCPKCQAKIHFSVAKLNGHVWGRCETEGCLVWMM